MSVLNIQQYDLLNKKITSLCDVLKKNKVCKSAKQQIEISNCLLDVLMFLDKFSNDDAINSDDAFFTKQNLLDLNKEIRQSRLSLDSSYFLPNKTENGYFCMQTFVFDIETRINLLCFENSWKKNAKNSTSIEKNFQLISPFLNVENEDFFGTPASGVAKKPLFFGQNILFFSLETVFDVLKHLVRVLPVVQLNLEQIEQFEIFLGVLFNRFCILSTMSENGFFLLPDTTEMNALIDEIFESTGVKLKQFSPLLQRNASTSVMENVQTNKKIMDFLKKKDSTLQDLDYDQIAVILSKQSLSDFFKPSLNVDNFTTVKKNVDRSLQIKLKLTGVFDGAILFDALFNAVNNATKMYLPPLYFSNQESPVSAAQEIENNFGFFNSQLQKWLKKNLALVLNDNFDTIYKRSFLNFFKCSAFVKIYQRIDSTSSNFTTEKMLQSFFNNGVNFVRQLYQIVELPLLDILEDDLQTRNMEIAQEILKKTVIEYVFLQKTGLKFQDVVIVNKAKHDFVQFFELPSIFYDTLTKNYYLLDVDKSCVLSADSFDKIFAKWLLFCFYKFSNGYTTQTKCCFLLKENNENVDLFPLFSEVF